MKISSAMHVVSSPSMGPDSSAPFVQILTSVMLASKRVSTPIRCSNFVRPKGANTSVADGIGVDHIVSVLMAHMVDMADMVRDRAVVGFRDFKASKALVRWQDFSARRRARRSAVPQHPAQLQVPRLCLM